MLFAKSLIACVFMILSVACAIFWLHVRLHPTDEPKYRKLVQESAELHSRRALEHHPAHQLREGVQKDIWAMKGTERLHCRLNSKHSTLTIQQKRDKFEALEELQQIHCWLQEKIDRNSGWQQVRTLIAEEGTYDYPSHRFLAQRVHFGFYRLPGMELPATLTTKPFLGGVAKQAHLTAADKLPTLTIFDITATLEPERNIP